MSASALRRFTRPFEDIWLAAILLFAVALCIFKAPALSLPLYHDEAWSYGTAVHKMYESGPGLLPSSLEPEYSRGHPLLFYFLGASWMKLFGGNNHALHVFALVISCLTLFAVYFLGRNLLPRPLAAAAVAIFALQEVFLAQSGLYLPEVMMALWTALVLLAAHRKKWILYWIFASLMLLTKESALVILLALCAWEVYESCVRTRDLKITKDKILMQVRLGAPLAVAVLFFLIQKMQRGWFFFPEHTGMIDTTPAVVFGKIEMMFNLLFEEQGRFVLTIVFFAVVAWLWKGPTATEKGIFFIFLALFFLFIKFFAADTPFAVFALIGIPAVSLVFILAEKLRADHAEAADLVGKILLGGFAYVLFSAINFFTIRYILLLLPLVILVIVYFIWHTLRQRPPLAYTAVLLLIPINLFWIGRFPMASDTALNYMDVVRGEQQIVNYLLENQFNDQPIYTNFFYSYSLVSDKTGYLPEGKKFSHVLGHLSDTAMYIVATSLYPHPLQEKPELLPQYKKIHFVIEGQYAAEVWKKVEPDSLK